MEVSKLTAVAFLISLVTQVFFVFTVLYLHLRRREAKFLWTTGVSDVDPAGLYNGLEVTLFVCQSIVGVCVCGGVSLKSFDVYFRRGDLVQHCIHRKVVILFRVSIFCNSVAALWYAKNTRDAMKVVFLLEQKEETENLSTANSQAAPNPASAYSALYASSSSSSPSSSHASSAIKRD